MFAIICIYFVFISKVNCLFVEMGEYPDHLQYDINLPNCGLRLEYQGTTQIFNISYSSKCFINEYENKSVRISFPKQENRFRGQVSGRIFGGRDARIAESPWTLRLDIFRLTEEDKPERCSGVLVTFQWLLTAAHCLVERPEAPIIRIEIAAGWHNFVIPPDLNMIFLHQGYNISNFTTWSDDIALIKLSRKHVFSISENRFITLNTICLPKVTENNQNEENATFSGWGAIDINYTLPRILQIGNVTLRPFEECHSNYKSGMVCADSRGVEPRPCKGDSGGPLVQYTDDEITLLIGITNSAYPPWSCQRGFATSFWVSVLRHIPWILQIIEQNSA